MLNIYNGLVWLLVPCSLVIINDTTAYLVGSVIGRTPLIKLSPKKTWEGFIGALVCTILWAYLVSSSQFSKFLQHFSFFTCPQPELTLMPFRTYDCPPNDFFIDRLRPLPGYLSFIAESATYSEFELHTIFLGIFAGFIAPFGGFFASGMKRAFKIKDFGDSIPGHGGLTDRVDCQLLMGMFTCTWTNSLVFNRGVALQTVLHQALSLSYQDQLSLLEELQLAIPR